MSHPTKGSILVANGNGKVSVISPTGNNQILTLDSNEPMGVKFTDIKNIMPVQFIKTSAANINSTSSATYEKIISLTIPGENMNRIQSIKILGNKDANVSSYDVRIQTSSGNIIAENNFTNNVMNINDMGQLTNLPLNETVIEVQSKKNGGNNNSRVYILEVTINYLNA